MELKKGSSNTPPGRFLLGLSTLHVTVIGAMVNRPVWVGNMAALYKVATLYPTP